MKKIYAFLALTLIALIPLWPFFHQGFFKSHDGDWMIIRFTAFHQTLRAGQFPVRFLDRLNNNYGYPVANFLYPLPFYLSEIPKISGFSFINSIKIIFITSTIGSVFAMYWALKKRFSDVASFAGAVIYLYVPYRFLDLYVRGSLGENMAFLFIPLCVGSFFQIKKGRDIYIPLLALFIALLILSHNVIAIVFLSLLLFTDLVFSNKFTKEILIAIALGLSISAFFWVPALFDLQYVKLSQIKVSEISSHLVSFEKILVPHWGYGPDPNATGGMSLQFGIISLFLFLTTAVATVYSKKSNKIIVLLLVIYIGIFFLMTKWAGMIWTRIPYLDVIQFPWRLLALIVLISAFFAAFIVDYSKKKYLVAFLLIVGSIVSTLPYAIPESFSNNADEYYSTNEATTTVRDEYMPIWVKSQPALRAKNKIVGFGFEVTNLSVKPTFYIARITSKTDAEVTVNTIYFPGWNVSSNGVQVPIKYESGLISFKLPKGEHDVIIKYGRTPVHTLAEITSVVGFFVAGFFLIYLWRKQKS